MPGKPKNVDLIKLDDVPTLLTELLGVTRNRSTIYNWVRHGRSDYHGRNVKLKTTVRLRKHYTTKQWVLDFIREIG